MPGLLLHGLAGWGGEWTAVKDALAKHGIGEEWLAPDLAGHGDNHPAVVTGAVLVDDAANRLVDPTVVVGQSMGGLVAMRVAAARPDLVSHLVLVEADTAAMTNDAMAGLQRWFASWPAGFADRAEAAAFFGADRPSTPAWVDGLAATHRGLEARFDASTMLQIMHDLSQHGSAAVWSQLRVPTLMIRAADSMLSDEAVAEMQFVRPEVRVVTIPNSGHDVHLDQPAAVADVIAAFLHQPSLRIATFTAVDQIAVQQLILDGLRDRWGSLDPTMNPDLDDIGSSYGHGRTVTIWDGDELVGTGTIIPVGANEAEIKRMSVRADRRGAGLGRLLVAELLHTARSWGVAMVRLETSTAWTEAVQLYLRCGFEITHTTTEGPDPDTHFARRP